MQLEDTKLDVFFSTTFNSIQFFPPVFEFFFFVINDTVLLFFSFFFLNHPVYKHNEKGARVSNVYSGLLLANLSFHTPTLVCLLSFICLLASLNCLSPLSPATIKKPHCFNLVVARLTSRFVNSHLHRNTRVHHSLSS